jgi:chitinase
VTPRHPRRRRRREPDADRDAQAISDGDADREPDADRDAQAISDSDAPRARRRPCPVVAPAVYSSWDLQTQLSGQNLVTSGSAAKLTHINYAFGNISTGGECFIVNQSGEGDAWADYGISFSGPQSVDGVADTWSQPLRGNFNQLKELKARYPHLKVLISLGGWTWSERFSDAAMTQAGREKLVRSCVDMFLKGNLPVFDGAGGPGSAAGVFDGIDVDWEYPGSEGLAAMCTARGHAQLHAARRSSANRWTPCGDHRQVLRAHCCGAAAHQGSEYEVSEVARILDFINVMTYDFRGSWDAQGPTPPNLYPDPQSPGSADFKVFSVKTAIDAWRAGGARRQTGCRRPAHGRGWTNVIGGGSGPPTCEQRCAAPTRRVLGLQVLGTCRIHKHRDPVTKQM